MEIRQLEVADRAAVQRFVGRVPDADRTFFKEDVAAAEVIEGARAVQQEDAGYRESIASERLGVEPGRRGLGER